MVHPPAIAKIIGSTDHSSYISSEVENAEDQHWKIGSFVGIGDGSEPIMVGMIVSSRLVPEDGFAPGPLQVQDLSLFSPELLSAAHRLLVIRGLGVFSESRTASQETSSRSPELHDPVFLLTNEQIREFHLQGGRLNLSYLSRIDPRGDSEAVDAIVSGLRTLKTIIPEKAAVMDLMTQEMEWNHRMKL
jgi:hypothetical protein